MMYATETVLALHRARMADEARTRAVRDRTSPRTDQPTPPRMDLRPAPAR